MYLCFQFCHSHKFKKYINKSYVKIILMSAFNVNKIWKFFRSLYYCG